MASRLTGSVYTPDVTSLEHLRVRLTVPGSPPIDVSLDEAGGFSVPVGHAESRDDEPGVTDPDRYDDELDQLGITEFLEATQADTSDARAIVAQILYEDPSLLVADPTQLTASLEVVDTRTGTALARHDFFPAAGLLEAPTSLELAVPPIAALDVGPALAETTTADAKLARLTAACAIPYSPALPRTKAFSFWRSAAQLIKGDAWRVVFEAKDEFHTGPSGKFTRDKAIHQFGVAGPIDFVPSDTGFRGLLAERSKGIIRLGLGLNDRSIVVPGVALKFPVSGARSVNLVALPTAHGQGDDRNFFAANPRTEVGAIPPPSAASTIKERMFFFGLRKLEARAATAIKDGSLLKLPLERVFAVTQSGASVQSAVPAFLDFQPTASVRKQFLDASGLVLHRLASIDDDTVLFEVRAAQRNQHGEVASLTKLGDIVLTGPLTESPFGDRELHFHHDYPLT